MSATESNAVGVEEPVAATVRRRKRRKASKPKRQPRYNVVLWNDDDHTYEYVEAMLMQLFGHTRETAHQMADGRVVVLTTTREHAELKRDQIHAFGKDPGVEECAGSMWATIEPVEGP